MKIGNLELQGNVFLAPMAGITDPPFRKVVQRFGVSALWTEMISAQAVIRSDALCRTMSLEEHAVPTIFQIYGNVPEVMAEAAARTQALGAAAVDINMGCPVRKIVGKGCGAALMRDLSLAGRVVEAVRGAVSIPVTVKMRAGWDDNDRNAVDLAKIAESEGADALVIHARNRAQKHSGPASMEMIRDVKLAVSIPVIGNGGVMAVEDAFAMMEQTGCDGVMVGRGALGRPWLPGRILTEFLCGPFPEGSATFMEVIRAHYQYQLEFSGLLNAIRRMRKHLAWYSRGFPGGAEFRWSVFRMEDPERVFETVERFFGEVVIS
jgi:tRNA-dihydrouridine synthase B